MEDRGVYLLSSILYPQLSALIAKLFVVIGGLGGQQVESAGGFLIAGVVGGGHQKARGGLRVLQAGPIAREPVLGDYELEVFEDLFGGQHASSSIYGEY